MPLPGDRNPIEEWQVLDLLTGLVDKSLVVYEENAGGRYRRLETARQYARDRLLESEESAAVRTERRAFFLRLAEEAVRKLPGPEQAAWLDRLETEHDNLRAARLLAASEALREAVGTPRASSEQEKHERSLAAIRAELGEGAFAKAWAEGGAMASAQAVEYALGEQAGPLGPPS
jgi:hypothetical protein